MNNYIQIYKNVIDNSYCDELVNKFESNPKQRETHEQGPMSFAQINLNLNKDWNTDVYELSKVYTRYLEQYKKDCAVLKKCGQNYILLNKSD